jgi:hypothetical protein
MINEGDYVIFSKGEFMKIFQVKKNKYKFFENHYFLRNL